jgi:hypothetical protein
MIIETKKVLVLVALIVAAGIATVEATRSQAQADAGIVPFGAAGYAGTRVDNAFQLVASSPQSDEPEYPVAEKGDLVPLGCAGPFRAAVQAECIDTAFEIEAEPSTVVETRFGAMSILTRMDGATVADFGPAAADFGPAAEEQNR